MCLHPGNILKEAIEDLEWPGSSVTIRLQRDPARISLKASGNGSLEVRNTPNTMPVLKQPRCASTQQSASAARGPLGVEQSACGQIC